MTQISVGQAAGVIAAAIFIGELQLSFTAINSKLDCKLDYGDRVLSL